MDKLLNMIENRNDNLDITHFYAAQEFSRKICDWNLVFMDRIDHKIMSFLSHNRILAGGAVLDILRGTTPRDYDIFFINKIPYAFIEKMKKNDYAESLHCISISVPEQVNNENNYFKIQFIKRLYDNPSRVIGGFDLDACRFFMNHLGEIYGTSAAVYARAFKKIIINPCCQSENFYARIMKYQRKKQFKIIHPHFLINHRLFKNANDYSKPWYDNEDRTFMLIISGKAHKCLVYNHPITLEDLKHKMNFYIQQFGLSYFIYAIPELRGKKLKNVQNIPIEILNEILTEKYEDYKKLSNFLLTNTSSQMTASFHPTTYRFSEIYPGIRFDILKNHLRAIFAVIRFGRLPKVIYYKIFRDYYDELILEKKF